MKNKNTIILLAVLGFLLHGCKRTSDDLPTPEVKKHVVKAKLYFGPTFENYALYLGLQATSVDGGLGTDFDFIGIESSGEAANIRESSVIKTASYTSIPTREISFKTSKEVSTLTIVVVAPPQLFIENSMPTLDLKIEFFIDGKKVSESVHSPFPRDNEGIVYVLDVSDPTNPINSNNE